MDKLAAVRSTRRLGGNRVQGFRHERCPVVLSGGGQFHHRQRHSIAASRFTNANPPNVRYWLWRFDRPDNPVGQEDFWGKTDTQAVADLVSAAVTDATLGTVNGASDVELVVDPYFPKTIGTVDPALKGRTIHAGGRCRVFLDNHVQFIKDARTPLP